MTRIMLMLNTDLEVSFCGETMTNLGSMEMNLRKLHNEKQGGNGGFHGSVEEAGQLRGLSLQDVAVAVA